MAASTTCIHCGAALSRPGAPFCPVCGRSQAPAQPAQPAAGAPMPATVIGLAPAPAAPPTVAAGGATKQPSAPAGATLTVQDGGQTRLVPLGNRPLTLGRAADNDIVSGSRFVSGHHARVEPNGAAHRIVDVGSTNGLLFEGRRLAPNALHDLFDGDVLRIGDPATGSFVSLSYHNPLAARAGAAQAAQSYRLDPNDPQITIGRAGCDITLDNPQVSRFHAQIDRLADGSHLLRDGGATNGVFVNGQRVSGQQPLRPGAIIQIGPFKLVYSGSSLDQYDQRGALRIDARNLSRAVKRGGSTRLILKDVSLSVAPREFVALVGGSGTGKSTLMNAMSGYARATSGSVAVNGDDYYRNFDAYRTVLGYVPQDDIIHRTIQVSSALGYAARLRLPADTAPSEIAQRIDKVLEDVEMAPHRDNLVDNLSGGQRKRVSIGVELLADPSLFFLDEPTSGLDPGLEKKMMYTLRRLADSGRTVVLVTHATANITQCDHVAFMSDGRMVFFGPPAEALPFFGVGTGDFADIYTKLEGAADATNPIVQRDLQGEFNAWRATNPNAKAPPTLAELWELKFRASEQYRRYVAERLAQAPQGPVVANGAGATQRRKGSSPLRQLGILTRRYANLMLQDRRNLFILLLQAPVIGLLLLIVARGDSIVGVDAAQNQAKKVLFMLAVVAVWFGIINAAREITKEATIYRRERLANLRIGPYVLSKLIVLAGLVVVQSAVLLALVALRVRFPDAGVFLPIWLELFVTTLLTSLAGLSLGLVISAFASTPDRAISIVPLALIPQIVFAGLIFDIEGIATPLSWITISRWAMDAYGSIVDLNALPMVAGVFGAGKVEGRYSHTPGHLLLTWLVLLIYAAICTGITAVLLKRRDRQI